MGRSLTGNHCVSRDIFLSARDSDGVLSARFLAIPPPTPIHTLQLPEDKHMDWPPLKQINLLEVRASMIQVIQLSRTCYRAPGSSRSRRKVILNRDSFAERGLCRCSGDGFIIRPAASLEKKCNAHHFQHERRVVPATRHSCVQIDIQCCCGWRLYSMLSSA